MNVRLAWSSERDSDILAYFLKKIGTACGRVSKGVSGHKQAFGSSKLCKHRVPLLCFCRQFGLLQARYTHHSETSSDRQTGAKEPLEAL